VFDQVSLFLSRLRQPHHGTPSAQNLTLRSRESRGVKAALFGVNEVSAASVIRSSNTSELSIVPYMNMARKLYLVGISGLPRSLGAFPMRNRILLNGSVGSEALDVLLRASIKSIKLYLLIKTMPIPVNGS